MILKIQAIENIPIRGSESDSEDDSEISYLDSKIQKNSIRIDKLENSTIAFRATGVKNGLQGKHHVNMQKGKVL